MPETPDARDAEIERLRRCMNDLVGLLALPATWTGGAPSEIARSLTDAVLATLGLDFVYVRIHGNEGRIGAVRAASGDVTGAPQPIEDALERLFGADASTWPPLTRAHLAADELAIATTRLGLRSESGVLVAGSRRAGFPSAGEGLLLNIAANQLLIALQEAWLLDEQKRVAAELDERVARRTSELAEANEALKREIAERQRAEAALRESERSLQLIIDTMPAVAWSAAPDGSADFFNQHYLDYVGCSPQEARDQGWSASAHPDELLQLGLALKYIMASGRAGEFEARLRRHDGVHRWFLFRASPLRDDEGNVVKWYGVNTDIEDRKRAEQELRRSEAFLAEGMRLSQTGSISWRLDTDEIQFSEQTYRIFEIAPSTPMTLERVASRVHPLDLPLFQRHVAAVRRGEHSGLDYEVRLQMSDGRVRHVQVFGHGVVHRDGRVEVFSAALDITQRRLAQETLDKLRSELAYTARAMSLGVLTASIAHEVSQPLSAIVTNASTSVRMLTADPPNVEGALDAARRTIRDSKRAIEVIVRLRAFFRKKDFAAEIVDLNEAAREVLALCTHELQRHHVVVRADLEERLPPVTGDRVQLQQVILNLVLNARDAMKGVESRARHLVIETAREQDDRARLTVRDTGIGLTPEGLSKLFEPFYTTKADGMGVGLSISRSIIERHRGDLWATPNDGPGAAFSFAIPCRTGPDDGGPASASSSAPGTLHVQFDG
jgi:PAS domain S-box-containing protein